MMQYRNIEEIQANSASFDEFIYLIIDKNYKHINTNVLKFNLILSYNLNKCMAGGLRYQVNVCDRKQLSFIVYKDTLINNEHFRKHISFEYAISDVVRINRIKKIETLI